jgi:putative ABC transport system permease protein
LWQRLGSDPAIVGRTLMVSGTSSTVVGVLPARFIFEFPTNRTIDVWVPRVIGPTARASRRGRALYVVGRLKRDAIVTSAQAELDRVARDLRREHPVENAGWTVRLVPLRDQIVGESARWLAAVLAAVGVLLLTVCANVGSLLLSRGAARAREVAVRGAIGATRRHVLQQFLVESALIGLAGGGIGLVLAIGIVDLLKVTTIGVALPRLAELSDGWRLSSVAFVLALVTAALIGTMPAVQAWRLDLNAALRAGSQALTSRRRTQAVLVVGEIAMASVLLVVAGLLVRSFLGLKRVDPGFDPNHVMTMQLALPASYGTDPQIAAFYDRLMQELVSVPGVTAAGAVSDLPFGGSNATNGFEIEGRAVDPANPPEADFRCVTPGYFGAVQMPLLAGRPFTAADRESSPSVAIVNRAWAKRFWQGEDVVGKRVKFTGASGWTTVVGVVGDVRHSRLAAEPRAEIYVPQRQAPNSYMYVAVRAATDPSGIAAAMRRSVRALDPELPLYKLQPLAEFITESIARERFASATLTAFCVITVLLAAAGLYGVIAYAVACRTREIGIRLALGAQPGQVRNTLIADALWLTGSGLLIGLVMARVSSQAMRSILFAVSVDDPLTFVAAICLLAGVALVSAWLPARRVARLDPVVALRES